MIIRNSRNIDRVGEEQWAPSEQTSPQLTDIEASDDED